MSDWSHGYNVKGGYPERTVAEKAAAIRFNGQVVLTDPEAQRNEAIRQATLFIEKTLPAWERLGAWS